MLLSSKSIPHASAAPSHLSSHALGHSSKTVLVDTRLLNVPRARSSIVEDVTPEASTSSLGGNIFVPSSLRHLENSWGRIAYASEPWTMLVSVDEKPNRTRNVQKTPAFFANVGDAIRSLREDIPSLFERELNYEIYTENLLFKDPRVSFQGLKNYKTMFWSLRFHGKLFFKDLFVEVQRIWQPEDFVIKMRWTVHGVPRMLSGKKETLFEGISTYKLDEDGRVYQHSVDNVLLRDTPMFQASPILAGIDRALGAQVPQQSPYPGAWGCEGEASPESLTYLASQAKSIPLPRSAGNVYAVLQVSILIHLYGSLLASKASAAMEEEKSSSASLSTADHHVLLGGY
eukprot:gene1756-33168_t